MKQSLLVAALVALAVSACGQKEEQTAMPEAPKAVEAVKEAASDAAAATADAAKDGAAATADTAGSAVDAAK